MKNANERTDEQAPHYQTASKTDQHWDRAWEKYREAWFVLNITKYVERHSKKNGRADLVKAEHYLQKLIELEEQEWREAHQGEGRNPGSKDVGPMWTITRLGFGKASSTLLAEGMCELIEGYRRSCLTNFDALYHCRIALGCLINYIDEVEKT